MRQIDPLSTRLSRLVPKVRLRSTSSARRNWSLAILGKRAVPSAVPLSAQRRIVLSYFADSTALV
jgi:hypothetical protein